MEIPFPCESLGARIGANRLIFDEPVGVEDRVVNSPHLYRPVGNADFNSFASHARIADHPFFLIALAQLVRFLMKWDSTLHDGLGAEYLARISHG